MELTCISCPMGCRMIVDVQDGKVIRVRGNACPRGEKYAQQEAVSPQRVVTAVVSIKGSQLPLSVKTDGTIPKDKIFDVMVELNALQLQAPIKIGDVVVKDVCGTDVDVIATKSVPLETAAK